MANPENACEHVTQVKIIAPENTAGCEECLKIGGRWVNLRICLTCGKVGCCDNSPNKHATAHFHETEHPIIQSMEAGETWAYCYVDETTMDTPPEPSA